MSMARNLIITTFFLLTVVLLPGCAGRGPLLGSACPESLDGFMANKDTSGDVVRCLGQPGYEDHSEDGSYKYLYTVDNKRTAVFEFDASDRLERSVTFSNVQ